MRRMAASQPDSLLSQSIDTYRPYGMLYMPRPTKQSPERGSARIRLLDAARDIIRAKGFAATTVDDLCKCGRRHQGGVLPSLRRARTLWASPRPSTGRRRLLAFSPPRPITLRPILWSAFSPMSRSARRSSPAISPSSPAWSARWRRRSTQAPRHSRCLWPQHLRPCGNARGRYRGGTTGPRHHGRLDGRKPGTSHASHHPGRLRPGQGRQRPRACAGKSRPSRPVHPAPVSRHGGGQHERNHRDRMRLRTDAPGS